MDDMEWQAVARERARKLTDRIGSVRGAAKELGVNHEGLRRLLDGRSVPRGPDREAYLRLAGVSSDATTTRPVSEGVATAQRPATPPSVTGRTFATDDARIAYVLGVLDMAGTSNQIAMQSSAEVSRAITTAAAALIAPLAPTTSAAEEQAYSDALDAGEAALAAAQSAAESPRAKKRTK